MTIVIFVFQREESHYSVCRHHMTSSDDESLVNNLKLMVVHPHRKHEDGMQKCVVVSGGGSRLSAGTTLRLVASR